MEIIRGGRLMGFIAGSSRGHYETREVTKDVCLDCGKRLTPMMGFDDWRLFHCPNCDRSFKMKEGKIN